MSDTVAFTKTKETDEAAGLPELADALLSEWSACPSANEHGISSGCGSDDCTFTVELFDVACDARRRK